ncbi:phosphotransferase family protein [Paraconexibacter antarcticus]|uniref:Phosphotransferase family protein n=1 Tax=Paraconexibacter antarcticus TaxID=2949664 RepID=A0ABY5DT93_9ACTN|nr:phosphotransferase family protein [Paraconexibacter antarcticus]UTI64171.1 phosphotransferase family protein [Paraconexibacter antarcticus]
MSHEIAPDDIVRSREEVADGAREPLLVLDPLLAFLDSKGLGAGDPDPVITPIGDGHSNVTYAVTRGDDAFVLRRPPRGPLPPSAHDVLREARVIRAVQDTPVRAPRVLAVGEDPSIIGAPFFVMEHMDGHVITTEMPSVLDTPEERRRTSEELVDALVELHAVDWAAAGLEGFGKPTGYLERQVRRFLGLWDHNRTREIPEVERVATWLTANLPDSGPATIVHGDFRLGNVMFAKDAPARCNAIFDWEMSTIGDPLADVGYLCMMWSQQGDPTEGMAALNGVTRAEGFLTREELVARYEAGSGRSMQDARWYLALALWKAIVFMEGNYKRAISGATDDPFLKTFGDGVIDLAQRAEAVTRGE